jgi:hypothetical protein
MSKKKTKVEAKPEVKDVEIIVYYVNDKPDTIYTYYNKPLIGERPYAEITGWWLPVENSQPVTYHFEENKNKRPMLMDKDWLINKLIPDKSAIKYYDSMDEFIIDQL